MSRVRLWYDNARRKCWENAREVRIGSFHANWTKGVKLISQKMLKKIYVVQRVEYFNHANV